ncbi:MAG TPA: glycerol-3-phosphate 1-O-acyltransferase PlsY [Dongiaceae bacterium]|nr:glycerol-3-phosphate 1-O-acyltransferase PlsY [Dongiaceae bacterium]
MTLPLANILLFAGSYLLGSIPFGLLLALLGGKDVRKSGSGNIGANNVARVVGPLAGILTLFFDAAKGWLPVWLAARLAHGDATTMTIAGALALAGHCFPIWLRFHGGKGVATAAGVFAGLCPAALIGALILFALVVGFWRYVSLGSIAAAAALPLLVYLLWAPHFAPPASLTLGSLAMAALVIYRHRGNILRLARGEEPKFSVKKSRAPRGD